jgi:hypothetical protein
VQELETLREVLGLEQFSGFEHLGSAEAELGVLATALGPFAGALAEQAGANADHGLDTDLLGDGDDLFQLFELLHDHDDLAAKLDAHEGHLDKAAVFVAVADDETAHLVLEGETGVELGFAADFEAEVVLLARVEDLLNHFTELVHLDGKHAAVLAFVIELGDGVAESLVDGLDAVTEDVLKADEQGKLEAASLGFLNDIGDIDAGTSILQRRDRDVALLVDIEIFRAPTINVVKRARRLDVPWTGSVLLIAHFLRCKSRAHYKECGEEFNRG